MASYGDSWFGVHSVALILDENGQPTRLEGREGRLLVANTRADPEVIVATTTAFPSTLTPLTAWLDRREYFAALFTITNLDAAENVTMVTETSEDAAHADVNSWLVVVPAGKQGTIEVSEFLRRYWRVSAYSDSPGFPNVPVTIGVAGTPR